MKKFLIILIFLIFGTIATAETIIYDDFTISNYKVLIIGDDLNIGIINDYTYDVYLDGAFLGNYKKDDKIFVPDNSNVSIYIPRGNIQTDLTMVYDQGKTQIYIALMYIVSGFLILSIIIYFIKKLWRR